MPLSSYISFAGNCADAISYYQQTLGAELLYKLRFGEMPPHRHRITKKAARQESLSRYRYRSHQRALCEQRHHGER